MSTKLYSYRFIAMAVFCCAGHGACADPSARVGRLSYTEGTVSFHAADQAQWMLAQINYPITTGDALWTEPNARSEIQIDGSEIRMDQATQVNVVQLDDNATILEVAQGIVNIHISAPPAGGVLSIITPIGQVNLTQNGTYHIDCAHPDGDQPSNQVQVTALDGQIQFKSSRSLLEVRQGESAILMGNPPAFTLQQAYASPFDDWALERERQQMTAQSAHYVSPHMTGYEDLDHYGQWSNDANYGAIWYPANVESDWAPYRDGHWLYVQPWGWTWVDDAPWGFAPFHYGRWARIGPRWGWVPGNYVERPIYAPALVAFIGGPERNMVLISGSSLAAVGWVPLAPREVFHPYYPASTAYIRNVNITTINRAGIREIHDGRRRSEHVSHYANQQAVIMVPTTAFTRGAPVHQSQVAVAHEQLMHTPVTPQLTHLQPTVAHHGGDAPSPNGVDHLAGHNSVTPFSHAPSPKEQRERMYPRHEERIAAPIAPTLPASPSVQIPHPVQQPAQQPALKPPEDQAVHMPTPSGPPMVQPHRFERVIPNRTAEPAPLPEASPDTRHTPGPFIRMRNESHQPSDPAHTDEHLAPRSDVSHTESKPPLALSPKEAPRPPHDNGDRHDNPTPGNAPPPSENHPPEKEDRK